MWGGSLSLNPSHVMPRNLLFQNNVFTHPYSMLKSSDCANLANRSAKATSQNFTICPLKFSTTWHFSTLHTEVEPKRVIPQQLSQIFWRLKQKKKDYFSQLPCHVSTMTQSRIQHNGLDWLDLNRSQHTPSITCRELGGERVHFFVHHFLV